MTTTNITKLSRPVILLFALILTGIAQESPDGPPRGDRGRGPGGPGGFNQKRDLVAKFDKDDDERLNAKERQAALAFLKEEEANGEGRRRRGPWGRGGDRTPPEPGPKVAIEDVDPITEGNLYDLKTLRTLFFEFEDADWEKQLIAFNNTDIELPAKLTVDGKAYKDVGVRVRGASSSMAAEGYQRPLNISIDYTHDDQRLDGYKTLNLHNSSNDPSMMRGVLYLLIAREYIPAAKCNLVRVVINGENWGRLSEWSTNQQGVRG